MSLLKTKNEEDNKDHRENKIGIKKNRKIAIKPRAHSLKG